MEAREIKLSKGQVAIVDDADFEFLNQWKWSTTGHGVKFYAHRVKTINGVSCHILMHRLLMGLSIGEKVYVDHINNNGLDNRRANLRIVTKKQNAYNSLPIIGKKSEYKGVCFDKQRLKWRASICPNRKYIVLGIFKEEIDAAKAYNDAAIKHYGEFAYLNKI